MGIFKTGVDIGKTVAGRVKGFSAGGTTPKKKPRGKRSTCWIICPSFHVKAPKVVSAAAREKDYAYSVEIFSTTRKEWMKALDHMISCGKEEIKEKNKRFWLHAVTYGIQHKALFQGELKYIFRVKQIPDEIL